MRSSSEKRTSLKVGRFLKSFISFLMLPRNKPKTILSQNKHLPFPTAFDLPQRPNEAHIFYGNMSKIVVSLLGSARTSAHIEQSAVLLSPGRQNLQPERCSQKNTLCSNDILDCLLWCPWFVARVVLSSRSTFTPS